MDFEEMKHAYKRAEEQFTDSWSQRSKNYGQQSTLAPTVYDHIVVERMDGTFSVCRTNSAGSMTVYSEVAMFKTKFEATDVCYLLNQREGQK